MWILVVVAGIFEVAWATGLKYSSTPLEWTLTIIGIIASFILLLRAATVLPTTTVYAVFVGLGTVGTVLFDVFIFDAQFNLSMLFFLALLLIGVVGLKLITDKHTDERSTQ